MQVYQADLHIHTALSACAETEMLPPLIVEVAIAAGLDLIAIADHNSCENAGAVIEAASNTGLAVIPGLEVQTAEGVHVLCLFGSLDHALAMQSTVYGKLPKLPPDGKLFSQQFVVGKDGEFLGFCREFLSLPCGMDIDDLYARIQDLGGLIIPSHIDRKESGLCGVLGFVPDSPSFDALEVSRNTAPSQAGGKFLGIGKTTVLSNSDAHWLAAIGERRTALRMEHRNLAELRMALRGLQGRGVENA